LTDPHTPHLVFVGRWCPLHLGHVEIIRQKHAETELPVLVLVRDTSFDEFPAEYRRRMVEAWLEAEGLPGRALVIPDVHGVFYGRGVGYVVEEVLVEKRLEGISATKIRAMRGLGDERWRALVAPGVAAFIDREGL